MRLVTSIFDFIEPQLYTNPDKYIVKVDKYYMWSEVECEYQEYEITEATDWNYLQPFVEKGIVYVA